MTRRFPAEIADHAAAAMTRAGHAGLATNTGRRAAWLESCGYPGLRLLAEALADTTTSLVLERDAIGFDLQNVSAVFLANQLAEAVQRDGRAFLRNVRHGLYLVPDSVERNYGIGCPIDPGFALGGERSKNPYAEKLAIAAAEGVEIDDSIWKALD